MAARLSLGQPHVKLDMLPLGVPAGPCLLFFRHDADRPALPLFQQL